MKVKHVLVLLAIAACLIASGAAVFVKLSFDALDYTYDPDAIKARHIEEVKSRVQWSREHPSSARPIVKAGTPVAIGEECDSLLSAAIIQNGSAQPEIKIDGFLDE